MEAVSGEGTANLVERPRASVETESRADTRRVTSFRVRRAVSAAAVLLRLVSFVLPHTHTFVVFFFVFFLRDFCLLSFFLAQDAFAAESHARAHRAQEEGLFEEEILPVRVSRSSHLP